MRRIVLIVFGIALVFVPVVLLAIVNREAIFKQFRLFSFLVRPMRSEQFAVKSSVPHFTPKLVNTSFLDYVMSTMNIFEKDAIVDPDIYWKSKGIKTRYTVSRIQIELVPTLERDSHGGSISKRTAAKQTRGKLAPVTASRHLTKQTHRSASITTA